LVVIGKKLKLLISGDGYLGIEVSIGEVTLYATQLQVRHQDSIFICSKYKKWTRCLHKAGMIGCSSLTLYLPFFGLEFNY
jgi:hypothetical protein